VLTFVFLIIIIFCIIVLTTQFKLHPFLTLLLAAILMGLLSGLDLNTLVTALTDGFGNTLKSIGIVIACGTVIGTFLERSGGARKMAATILRRVGERKAPLAMTITGFFVSIPVFCDSGFVILSALNKALSKRTGISLAVLAVALGTGLYATHVFVPPTPGPLAAAATIEADLGLIIFWGLIVAIPAAAAGLLWALFFARRFVIFPDDLTEQPATEQAESQPGAILAFAPLVIPIILIALKSLAEYPTVPLGKGIFCQIVRFIGHPVIALMIGVFLAFTLKRRSASASYLDWVGTGLQNAGVIILITGAGGAFGNVLRTTDLGENLGRMLSYWQISIFLPFVIAAILKTAQGSSTVAIITTAALISPLLSPLGLATPLAKAFTVLAIGAGSMTVSHVNDSYFWVVAQFSNLDTATALRCHTLATLVQGVVGMLTIAILFWVLV